MQKALETFADNLAIDARTQQLDALAQLRIADRLEREARWSDHAVSRFAWQYKTHVLNAFAPELDIVQATLDVIGTADVLGGVPYVGKVLTAISVVADTLNGFIHLARGNNLAAATSFFAAVPYVGLAAQAGKATRGSVRILTKSDEAVAASRAFKQGRRHLDDGASIAKHAPGSPGCFGGDETSPTLSPPAQASPLPVDDAAITRNGSLAFAASALAGAVAVGAIVRDHRRRKRPVGKSGVGRVTSIRSLCDRLTKRSNELLKNEEI